MTLRPLSWALHKQRLTRSSLPILVGPFRGEVGFEALYWIPFVRRFAKKYQIAPERLIPITRGGAAVWYGTPQGIELYALRTPQEVRVETRIQHAEHKLLKQLVWTPFERAVVADVAHTLGVRRYLTLHPSWMFRGLDPFFNSAMSLADLEQQCLFDALTVPPVADDLGLPPQYVAVRFYLRPTFPPRPDIIEFASAAIKQIALTTPVVLLGHDLHLDDHQDIPFPAGHPNVIRLADVLPMTAENNLAHQSAVLARALAFVGTYGGLAQLALRLGRPSVSFYHEWSGTAMAHKQLADSLSLRSSIPCQVHRIAELPMLQQVLPQLQLVTT